MWEKELETCKKAAVAAGKIILEIYNSVQDLSVEYKEGDMPLTIADKKANDLIVNVLKEAFPTYAILSEEEKDNKERLKNDYCFVVDPLDGTKEFLKRNGQFTVNIALAYKKRVVLGVIYVPCSEELFYANKGNGAYRQDGAGAIERLKVSAKENNGDLRVVLSNSHGCEAMDEMLKKYEFSNFLKVGSSLKGCMVAEGGADVYYRHNPTMEWDTAAMQCIVEEAGGIFRQMDATPMYYNRENSLNDKGFFAINHFSNLCIKHTYLITGITGFIGSFLAKTLMRTVAYEKGDMKIYGLARNISLAKQMFEDMDLKGLEFIEGDICNRETILSLNGLEIDFILHCAAVTQSLEMVEHPVETADGIVLGTKNLLELARLLQVKSMVLLSSMEVYGVVEDDGQMRSEEELGSILSDDVRSCYPMGKRMAEHYSFLYAKEYGVPVKIARLAQVFGKGVRQNDNRVYMQFSKAVKSGEDIILKTNGMSMGNYCATEDAAEAIFTILFKGTEGEAYNVVNEENTMRIRDLAELVANKIAGGKIQVKYEIEDTAKTGYASLTGLRLTGKKLRSLGWEATKGVEEMIQDVMQAL